MADRDHRLSFVVSRRHLLRCLASGAALHAVSSNLPGGVAGGLAAWQAPAASATAPLPQGAIIRTVLRDLAPESLAGPILTHEHLSMTSTFMTKFRSLNATTPPPPSKPLLTEDLEVMVQEIQADRADGIACIVDAGSAGIGRSMEFLTQLSTRTGMPIVAAGGYFIEPFYPSEVTDLSEDQLAEKIVRDSKAERWGAMGELGTQNEINPLVRKVLRAHGKAHLQTNLPIFTHTSGGRLAVEQLDTLESVGVKPQRVMIGHISRLNEPGVDVHKAIARRGAFLGFDQVGRGPADANQVTMIQALVEAGYASSILLSADFGGNEAEYKRNGGPGFAKPWTQFVPMLRRAGVSETTIRTITVDNPRRFLAFVPKA